MWIAPTIIPAPTDNGTREAIFQAIEAMGDGTERYTKPENASVKAEWTGFRSDAQSSTEPQSTGLSSSERYSKLMADPTRTSETTILYFHGGAYYMCGFATHRESVSKMAKACAGRALAVEYRLAPQSAFPSQLIDAFNAYLYLLYPPTGSFHQAVDPKHIILAGDSAGGNLAFALLQLLLQLHRTGDNLRVRYNGNDVNVPLPAGVAGFSAWLDVTRSSPSLFSNAKYDYLPTPNLDDATSTFPHDDIWPTSPPRGDIFCDITLLTHPLVSLLSANDWSKSPPMWFLIGDEALYDENAVMAEKAKSQGVTVQWEHYQAMPHCFNAVMSHLDTSKSAYKNFGTFARSCLSGSVEPHAISIAVKTGQQKNVELALGDEVSLTWEQALKNMADAKARRSAGYEKEGKGQPKLAI